MHDIDFTPFRPVAMEWYFSVSNNKNALVERRDVTEHVSKFSIERRCLSRPILNTKRVLIEGGMYVGNFPIEMGYNENVVHAGKLFIKR